MEKGTTAMKKKIGEQRCKHGLVPEWCAYCLGWKVTKVKATGRGVGRTINN